MQAHSSFGQLGTEGDTVRIIAPIRLVELYSMPTSYSGADQLIQSHLLAFRVGVTEAPRRDEGLHKPLQISVLRSQRPIEPAGIVVLAIRVVVAQLCPPGFISHDEHG